MNTLASRPAVLNGARPEAGGESHDEPFHEVLRPGRPDLSAARERAGMLAARARPSTAAQRRRVVLGVLLAGLAVVGGLVATGILLPVALGVPVTLILAFLGVARHQVSTARRRRAQPRPQPSARPGRTVPSAGAAGGAQTGTWEARPTTLPTYVTAPPAPGFPRVIDTAPGAWTAAAMLERAQQEKLRAERMAAAKAEAVARARAEQAAAEARGRDEDYLAAEAAQWPAPGIAPRRRVVNE